MMVVATASAAMVAGMAATEVWGATVEVEAVSAVVTEAVETVAATAAAAMVASRWRRR